ncbi:MAG TPA: endolytic transglycosylase MltG, partial [Rhodospirillales bacterium]|nr:endolytic transglycosylase MltG [Rhodospirillales bacterium]
MNHMVRWLSRIVIVFLLLGLIGGGVYAWGYGQFVKPGPSLSQSTVIISQGQGVDGIANALAQAGVIDDGLIFRLGVRLDGGDKALQAGEYIFPAKVSARQAADILSGGKTVVRRLTIAEGLSTAQVLEQLLATDGLDGDILMTYGEGTLLPETYHFSYGDSRTDIAERMATSMTRMVGKLWATRASGLPLATPQEALILASIVEKETALASERPRIAGVFINRLLKRMRLQSDPTVSYGLTLGQNPLGRPLNRQDLKHKSPYNTYLIDGLPPGPI